MKSSTILASCLAAASLTVASPTPWDKWSSGGRGKGKDAPQVFEFTSTYFVTATPDQVIASNNASAPGQPDAIGLYHFGINSELDTICYNITLLNLKGTYQSPAKTATHIHQAAKGFAGPPRISFPNPVADANNDKIRRSSGCLTGPFLTGVTNAATGMDTGTGFKVAAIEKNPAAFFCDVHTNLYVPGAVRGQLA